MIAHVRNIILCLCCSYTLVNAQQFKTKASLQSIDNTGFYAVDISPAISAFSQTGFEDLRVADEKDHFIPYIIRLKSPVYSLNNYERFNIINNTLTDSGKSVLIIENSKQQKISGIALQIRNASVSRTAGISGSDNGKNWFAIAESINLESSYSDSMDRYIQNISFPLSSYRYFKISINNGKNDALNITEAGRFTTENNQQANTYLNNPALNFKQSDSAGISYIHVTQPATYHSDKITVNLKGPKFFKREVDIIINNLVHHFSISSDAVFSFYVLPFNQSKFLIKIYNGDNPPLAITAVSTAQQARQIVTYLEAGNSYHLLLNDSAATKPSYDLQQFKDSIPVNIPLLSIASFENNYYSAPGKEATSKWKKWLWPVMIMVLVIVGLFTLRLAKEVQRKQ